MGNGGNEQQQAEIDRLAAAFQNGFTNANDVWQETPEYHKNMFREGVNSLLAELVITSAKATRVSRFPITRMALARIFANLSICALPAYEKGCLDVGFAFVDLLHNRAKTIKDKG